MALVHRSRRVLLAIVLLIIGVVAWFGPDLLARIINQRTAKVMEEAAGPRSRITIGQVHLEILPGNITWSDLRIEQRIDSADTSWTYSRQVLIAGHAGRIQVKGLSLWRLLLWKTIDMHTLTVQGADLQLITSDRNPHGMPEGPGKNKLTVHRIRLDSLLVEDGSIAWRNVQPGRPGARARHFSLSAAGLNVQLPHRHKPFRLAFTAADATIDSTEASFPPLYDLGIAHVHTAHPDSLFLLAGITLTSRKGPQEYGSVVPFETDLTTFTSDTISLRGLDISALLNERSLRAGEARISGTSIHDFRDKTIRDAPFRNKPMPARLLRQLPFTLRLDSLVVERMNVEYNEKDTVTSGFGQVDFTDINAVAHGINTTEPGKEPEMHLTATARVYEKAPIHFDFRTAIFDSSDHFSVKARIGPLPFKVFNAMTNDLLLVRATAGTIGGIDYTFEANRNQGHGRVDVEYQGLKLSIAKRDGSREKNTVKSFLVNQLVRSKNLREGNFRHGDFTVQRAKDRQVFNYLWRGLREGMMETVLPQMLKDVKSAVKTAKGAAGKQQGK